MLRDIYAIPDEEPRFKEDAIEITGELDEIIQQVDMILFTNKGDVLCMPEFGCDLGRYLFETTYNERLIKNIKGSERGSVYISQTARSGNAVRAVWLLSCL